MKHINLMPRLGCLSLGFARTKMRGSVQAPQVSEVGVETLLLLRNLGQGIGRDRIVGVVGGFLRD